ncbi:hypothetical protein [Paraburkholderia sp.]|uniref:hypothetical protein n=1 Tax=Paraburkholderia sp. TaxID=1926495 RepID=UPI003D6E62B3
MKKLNVVLGLSVAAVAVCASGVAEAARVGVYIGGGGYYGGGYYPWAPYYYPPYAPYPPAVAVPVPVPAEPQEYVEQGQPGAASADGEPAQAPGTWYYCDATKTYYPYAKQCHSGWRAVPAQPSAPGN